jgi:hypothetical protein
MPAGRVFYGLRMVIGPAGDPAFAELLPRSLRKERDAAVR